MSEAAHILTAALVWMLLGNSLRFAAVGSNALVPLATAGWRALWGKLGEGKRGQDEFGEALDALYMKLLRALTTATSAALVYLGIAFMGVGMAIGSFGNVFRYMSNRPEYWASMAQAQTVTAIPLLVVGMSCIIAAVSPRRTASLLMSGGFILAGVGIGVITASMGPR